MADSAADILAPNQPWTPPASAPPAAAQDAINPAASTDTPPPSATPQNMLNPASAQEPYTPPPATPTSPDVSQHMDWIHRGLDKVATLLGGGQTLTITKNPDGTVQMDKRDSTEKEKWGRIAAAALSGAAAGLANSQGPGGLARAGAAGFQAGAQIPQQQKQQMQQDVDFQNKQMMFKANRISLQQKLIAQTLANKEAGIRVGQEEVDRANKLTDELNNSPWHDKVGGIFPDMDTAMNAAKTDPNILKDHAQAKHLVVPEYGNDGSVKGFSVYNVDPSADEMRNTQPLTRHKMVLSPPDADGVMKPSLIEDPDKIAINGVRMGDYRNSEDKVTADYSKAIADYAKTKKDLQDKTKVPNSPQQALAMAAQTNDPTEKAKYVQLATDMSNTPEAKAKIAHEWAETGRAKAEEQKAKFDVGQGAEGSTLVDSIASGHIAIDRLGYLAARKPELLQAVTQKDPTFDSSKAAAYPEVYKQFTSTKAGTAGGALNAGGTALKHLNELSGMNTVRSHIPGDPEYNAYMNKADTVAAELAKFYGDATIPAIAAIKNTLTATLPGNRQAAIATQAKSMGDKLDSYEQQWKNAAPSKAYEAPMPQIDQKAMDARAALDPDYRNRQVRQYGPTSTYVPGKIYKVKDSSGNTVPIDGSKMATAWQRDPKLTVLGEQ